MDDNLRWHLEQGASTVKELARLTDKSTSTIYKALQASYEVKSKQSATGKAFWIEPSAPGAVEGGQETHTEEEEVQPPTNSDDSTQQPEKSASRGRKASAAGKRLFATVDANPRRANSHGHRSLQIIIDNPGITAEDFVAKGGRNVDLRWDLKQGNVRAE